MKKSLGDPPSPRGGESVALVLATHDACHHSANERSGGLSSNRNEPLNNGRIVYHRLGVLFGDELMGEFDQPPIDHPMTLASCWLHAQDLEKR